MAVFDWVESSGTQLSMMPRVSSTRYGDGYEERAPNGLNPLQQRWALAFRAADNSEADAMMAFLAERLNALGLEAFDWTPLWSTTPIKVVCREWNRSHLDEIGASDVNAVFEQVFEP